MNHLLQTTVSAMSRSMLFAVLLLAAQSLPAQKHVFLPDSLRCYNLDNDSSRWSWKRSAQTEDLVFFWEKGFGDNPARPPRLQGHPMSFDLDNLKTRVQQFYRFFRDTLKFSLPGSKADRYKMMVMVNYSLDGTAYGGTYDNFIGALWVAPNRIQDRKLNCLAHELGHSFQLQIPADSVGEAWGGSGFFEMTSQWMLWQVNPDWLTDENYHFEAFKKLTHKAYLDVSNIYHSPYVLEWWAEKHGRPCIAELYREGRKGEDPVMTYMRRYALTQQQFNDEMIACYQHLVNLDFQHAVQETRRYACQWDTPMQTLGDRSYSPAAEVMPEDYGFNAIRFAPPQKGGKVKARVTPLNISDGGGLRYGFVAVTRSGRAIYGKPVARGHAVLSLPAEPVQHLYLVVMGAPKAHKMLRWGDKVKNRTYPYTVTTALQLSHL